jgi:hypothetical protein
LKPKVKGSTRPRRRAVDVAALDGNNHVVIGSEARMIVSFGGGNNHVTTGDASVAQQIFVGGHGNNNIQDAGTNDLIWLGGDGNNNLDNQGAGSSTHILSGLGHNHIHGPFVTGL